MDEFYIIVKFLQLHKVKTFCNRSFQGSWGKRDAYPEMTEDEETDEDKRNWSSLRGTWGKRASDWGSFRGKSLQTL